MRIEVLDVDTGFSIHYSYQGSYELSHKNKETQKIRSPISNVPPNSKNMPLEEDKIDTVKLAEAINLARRYSVQNEYDLMQVRFSFRVCNRQIMEEHFC